MTKDDALHQEWTSGYVGINRINAILTLIAEVQKNMYILPQ